MKMFWGVFVIQNATTNICIEPFYPFRRSRPKLNVSRHLWIKFHSIESEAFSKSKNTATTGMFFSLVKCIVSAVNLILSPMNLPLTYPDWQGWVKFGKIFSKRRAMVSVAILWSTFSKDTGRQFFKYSLFFFFFGIKEIIPWRWEFRFERRN